MIKFGWDEIKSEIIFKKSGHSIIIVDDFEVQITEVEGWADIANGIFF